MVKSNSPKQTIKLGFLVGQRLKGGEVIDLIGDVGSGKTTFVKGLADGSGYQGDVTSPTFSLNNQYPGCKVRIEHLDFYRLSEPGLLKSQLMEYLADPSSSVVIEWSQIVAEVLPAKRLRLEFLPSGQSKRQLCFTCPAGLDYLLP